MRCDRCKGRGTILQMVEFSPEPGVTIGRPMSVPCPVCDGCGIRHCCDGDQPSARDLEEQADDPD